MIRKYSYSLHGSKNEFEFEARNHNELIEMNGWVDQSRGAKVAGSRFYFMQGDLARMEMASPTVLSGLSHQERLHIGTTSTYDESSRLRGCDRLI